MTISSSQLFMHVVGIKSVPPSLGCWNDLRSQHFKYTVPLKCSYDPVEYIVILGTYLNLITNVLTHRNSRLKTIEPNHLTDTWIVSTLPFSLCLSHSGPAHVLCSHFIFGHLDKYGNLLYSNLHQHLLIWPPWREHPCARASPFYKWSSSSLAVD